MFLDESVSQFPLSSTQNTKNFSLLRRLER